jgi:hypothetical protein
MQLLYAVVYGGNVYIVAVLCSRRQAQTLNPARAAQPAIEEGPMAERSTHIPTPADFLGPWKQMAEQAEQQWNQYFNQVMGTDAFATAMGRYMEGYLAFQQSLAQNVERSMQALNLPTRSDITAIAERLAAIEGLLSALVAEQQRAARQTDGDSRNTNRRAATRGDGA